MASSAGSIAQVVHDQFANLPRKRKPITRDNGIREWIPLSGIVCGQVDGDGAEHLRCLSLGTGMKCLPAHRLAAAAGRVLHDWHAEVVALRAFNRFMLEECLALARGSSSSVLLHRPSAACLGTDANSWQGQPFILRDDVRLYMYCSEAPCGDASMELTMETQSDTSPWPEADADALSPSNPDLASTTVALPGRAYFSRLGVVRRKPGRGDAPVSLSKSCSDKLALRQCVSLLSSLVSLFVSPSTAAYIRLLVLPAAQLRVGACARSFSPHGRLSGLCEGLSHVNTMPSWGGGYRFVPFDVAGAQEEFVFSKRTVAGPTCQDACASGEAVAWHCAGLEESLIGGVIRGFKSADTRGTSKTSRRQMWALAVEVATTLGGRYIDIVRLLRSPSYNDVKSGYLLDPRREVKEHVKKVALTSWLCNQGDADFSIHDSLPLATKP